MTSKVLGPVLIYLALLITSSQASNWPVIGIFAQPSSRIDSACGGSCQYIAASYVKYIEAAGARVVPVNYHSSEEELDALFSNLNGFLFPGGGSGFTSAAQYIFDKTLHANDHGDFMPLWGTCQGFQWLLMAASRNNSILDPSDGTTMDSENYSIPLDFTNHAYTSQLFSSANKQLMHVLATENVTMNNHHYGIWENHFYQTKSLDSFFSVLSTNKDRTGKTFISTMEAKKYPIFGTQWHPEKNNFEWARSRDGTPSEAINHSFHAVQVSQYTANFFVEQARLSTHSYKSRDEEDSALIWNYVPTKTTGSFVQQYFFHF